jgi:cytochrome c oxidase subunit I+III
MVILMLVAGSLYLSYVFSYLYLWTVAPQVWPAATGLALPALPYPVAIGVLLVASSALMAVAGRLLRRQRLSMTAGLVVLAGAALGAALFVEVAAQWQTGLRPAMSGYGAMVFMAMFLQAELVVTLIVMALFLVTRMAARKLDGVRRVTFDNTALLWHYTVGQGLLGLLLVHGFPRVAG